MNELEKALGSMEMRKPSPDYLDRGLKRIAAHDDRSNLVSANWRYASIGLAILLSVSVILNVVNWLAASQTASVDTALAFSVLRKEGETMIYETGYLYPADHGDRE